MDSSSSAVVPSAPAAAPAPEPAAELDEAAMNDLRNPDIQQKYRTAAEIANGACARARAQREKGHGTECRVVCACSAWLCGRARE